MDTWDIMVERDKSLATKALYKGGEKLRAYH